MRDLTLFNLLLTIHNATPNCVASSSQSRHFHVTIASLPRHNQRPFSEVSLSTYALGCSILASPNIPSPGMFDFGFSEHPKPWDVQFWLLRTTQALGCLILASPNIQSPGMFDFGFSEHPKPWDVRL